MILKPGLIPIQDDPENVRGRGLLRPDANTDAKRRGADPGTDPGVPARQSRDPIQRPEPGRAVPVCATGAGGARVHTARQEGAGSDSGLCEQGHGTEPAPGDAVDPPVPAERGGGSQTVSS